MKNMTPHTILVILVFHRRAQKRFQTFSIRPQWQPQYLRPKGFKFSHWLPKLTVATMTVGHDRVHRRIMGLGDLHEPDVLGFSV